MSLKKTNQTKGKKFLRLTIDPWPGAMAAAILEGHVTPRGREEGHVTTVTKEQVNWNRG